MLKWGSLVPTGSLNHPHATMLKCYHMGFTLLELLKRKPCATLKISSSKTKPFPIKTTIWMEIGRSSNTEQAKETGALKDAREQLELSARRLVEFMTPGQPIKKFNWPLGSGSYTMVTSKHNRQVRP